MKPFELNWEESIMVCTRAKERVLSDIYKKTKMNKKLKRYFKNHKKLKLRMVKGFATGHTSV